MITNEKKILKIELDPKGQKKVQKIVLNPDKDAIYMLSVGSSKKFWQKKSHSKSQERLDVCPSFEIALNFLRPNISAEISILYKLMHKENVRIKLECNHKAQNTSCLARIKGVLMDEAKAEITGKVNIGKNAKGTITSLHSNVLVLGTGIACVSQPIMEVKNKDVTASHGSTIGRVNEESMLYLTSRGLERREAEDLVVAGFLGEEFN